MTSEALSHKITALFKEKITELQREPAFESSTPLPYAVDNGTPHVKVAVGNVPLTYDLWKGLKNPAVVGLYPAGLREIWEFYAYRRKTGVDESGRPTIFQIPRSFDSACKIYNRAVLVSVMLPFSPEILTEYTAVIKKTSSSHVFSRMYEKVNTVLDTAVARVALSMVTDDTVVVPLDNETVVNISKEALPLTRQGASHGPSKGVNYPQKSIAALLGLGQFGVNRIIFRDEYINGAVERVTGPLRSLIIFDKKDMDFDLYVSDLWRHFLACLYDFTNTDSEINKYRFCSYIPLNDTGCSLCVEYCPSGAQANSVPSPAGEYLPHIAAQAHRFWEKKLQFDYARCCEERGQMASLFPEWSCARGLSVCAARGKKRVFAAKNFYAKRKELARV